MEVKNYSNDDIDNLFADAKNKKISTSFSAKSGRATDTLEDMFGIEEEESARNLKIRGSRRNNRPTTITSSKPLNTPKITKQGPSQSAVDDEEDDNLGFDPKKPKAGNRAQNLFDDLLTPLEKRSQTVVASGSVGGVLKAPTSRQSTDTVTENSSIYQNSVIRPKTLAGRRASSMSTVINPEPLVLFAKDRDSNTAISDLSTSNSRKTTANWLGLQVESQKASDKAEITIEVSKESKDFSDASLAPGALRADQNNANSENQDAGERRVQVSPVTAQATSTPVEQMAQNIILLNSMKMDAKHNINNIKYQEHHLILANQIKQQEKVLMETQRKQECLLQQQETQFQTFLQQQIQRHQQLEEVIMKQQQRLNSHLQLMMANQISIERQAIPELDAAHISSCSNQITEDEIQEVTGRNQCEKETLFNLIQVEAQNKRLELENSRLEELIVNTKNNYEKEIDVLEKSNKKQIKVLEHQLANIDQRFKQDIENVKNHYQQKLDEMKQEQQSLRKHYEEQITNLRQDHEDEVRKVHRNFNEDMEIVKDEYRRMIETIRETKLYEFATIQENGSYFECLKSASSNLKNLTGGLEELREDMRKKIDIIHLEKEKKLDLREKRVEDAEKRLAIMEKGAAEEKSRLLDMVSGMELQMARLTKETSDENWQLRQKLNSLDAEKAMLAKEKEHFRDQMTRDEQRLKDLKEQQLCEMQKYQIELQEERARLKTERVKFETDKRLQSCSDVDKDHMEVEAAMQVAHDAARKADMERERYYKMQRQLEQQKRDLVDKDHILSVREEELQQELLSYRMAERLSQESLQKSKLAEQYYHNKIQMLQQKSHEITEKEAHLSQERLLLSQDRIALHALRNKLNRQTKCSLCQISHKANDDVIETLNNNSIKENRSLIGSTTNAMSLLLGAQNDDLVEHLLDVNIAESLRKLNSTTNLGGWEALLDDDHKKLVQNQQIDKEDKRDDVK
uniref:Fas-binding factor 1 C-terminal domain-containing protein n=1 Tax=Glossina brevipalpis TaxID=37001 RepID=A0A1A9X0E5_9MUSC